MNSIFNWAWGESLGCTNHGNAVCASVHCLGIGQHGAGSHALLPFSMADLKRHEVLCVFSVNTVAGMNKVPWGVVFLLQSRRRVRIRGRWRETESGPVDAPWCTPSKRFKNTVDESERKEKGEMGVKGGTVQPQEKSKSCCYPTAWCMCKRPSKHK